MRLNRYKIGADVGGTFTDLVLFEENSQEIKVHKVPTALKIKRMEFIPELLNL